MRCKGSKKKPHLRNCCYLTCLLHVVFIRFLSKSANRLVCPVIFEIKYKKSKNTKPIPSSYMQRSIQLYR